MAWTTPRKWTTGELDTAALMNTHVRDNQTVLYGFRLIKGMCFPFSGTLGGTGNHYPVNPETAAADTRWHICNGDTENSVATPDLRDQFVIAAGSTYAATDTGGTATKDFSHSHEVGTYALADEGTHSHSVVSSSAAGSAHKHGDSGGLVTSSGSDITLWDAAHDSANESSHTHTVNIASYVEGAHTHTLSESTDTGGSATQSIMPPYYALVYICYVGA